MAENAGKIFTVIYRISNFSLVSLENGKFYKSSVFTAENLNGTKWFLKLYPDGCDKDDKGFISILMSRNSMNEHKSTECLSLTFEFCDRKGKILQSHKTFKEIEFNVGKTYLCPKFMLMQELKDCMKTWEDDTLEIRCHAAKKLNTQPLMTCEISTSFDVERSTFQFKFLLPDLEDWSQKIFLPFKSIIEFECRFTVTDDIVHLKIVNLDSFVSQKLYKFKTSILDYENNPKNSLKSEYIFDPSLEKNMLYEKSFNKMSVLGENIYYTLYSFTIVCDVCCYEREPSSTIEGYSYNYLFHVDPPFQYTLIQSLIDQIVL